MKEFVLIGSAMMMTAWAFAGRTVRIQKEGDADPQCVLVGDLSNLPGWALSEKMAIKQASKLGADTILWNSDKPPQGYICDPGQAKEEKARLDSIHAVKLTIRKELVSGCRFIRDIEAGYEFEAQTTTHDAGGNVFYIASETSKTETIRDRVSGEFRDYEVRHLTGQVYECKQSQP